MHLSKTFSIDAKSIGKKQYLNDKKSIYMSQYTTQKNEKKTCIFKCYREDQMQRLKRLQNNTHDFVIKPVCFTLQNRLFNVGWQIQSISLQTILFIHKMKKKPIQKELIRSFSKLYDTINKMHKGGLSHGNLKPTNIFVEFPDKINMSPQQIQWKVSQAGLASYSSCKFYNKPLINPSKSKSMFFDPKQNDFYSLGVIMLQMISLDPIQKIYQTITEHGLDAYFGDGTKKSQNQHFNNFHLTNFIRVLINPKQIINIPGKVKNINSVYHNYQDSVQIDQRISFQITYKDFFFSQTYFKQVISKQKIPNIFKDLQQRVKKQELKSKDILGFIKRQIDPNDQFIFRTSYQLQILLNDYFRLKLTDQDLLFFGFYFQSDSQINYMNILLRFVNKSDLGQNVIQKCIDRYNSARQFFQDQSKQKDFWRVEDIHSFFNTIKVPFALQDVRNIIKQWTKSDKSNSIKLDQFRRIFKGQNQSVVMTKSSKKIQGDKSKDKLITMLQQLENVKHNLVHFFRLNDLKAKWSVPMSNIKEQIKKYIKPRKRQQQKQIFDEMFQISRLSENSKQIDYIVLLKKSKLFQPIQLFRLILAQKINEQGKQALYKKYQKDQKGWSINSIIDFCHDQYLQFDQRQQRAFFNTLDKDDSGYITLKQLIFKLSGIKQFDIDFIVQTIKNKLNNNAEKVFDIFLKVDSSAKLLLNNTEELKQFFQILGLQIQPSHYTQLYQKFSRKGKFQYLTFMRYFCTLDQIFMKSCKLIIEEHYAGNFDKFFKIGLKGQKKKWTRQSLTIINDNLILGFKDRQLDQLWNMIDKNQEHSLTKQQIGSLFEKQVEKLQQFKGRNVDSLQDYRPKKNQQNERKNYDSYKSDNRITPRNQTSSLSNEENLLQKNQLVKALKQQKILPILMSCFKKSQGDSSVWIQIEFFLEILAEQRLKYNKKYIQKNFSHYIQKKDNNTICLNYFKFFLLVSQFKYDPPKQKAQCISWMLQTLCRQRRIKSDDIFSMCRRNDRMKLSDFERIVKKIIDEDIFFQDINDVWQFWGKPEYLTQQDYQLILEQSDPRIINKRMSFGANKQKNSPSHQAQPQTPYLRSKQQSARQKKRKQSRDSVQLNKFALSQKQKQQQDRQRRYERKDSVDRTQERDNYKKNNQKGNFKFPPKGDRKTSMQNDLQRKLRKQSFDDDNGLYNKGQPKQQLNDRNNRNRNYNQKRQKNEKSKDKNSSLSKKDLMNKFQEKLQQNSIDPLTNLFMDTNRIDIQIFAQCLMKKYQFPKKQAQQISQNLGSFGKIKIQTVKKYLKSSPKKKNQKEEKSRYNKQKQRTVQFSNRTPEKFQSDKMIQPVTRAIKPQKRLQNPTKQKLNTPLIKEQIKLLLKAFSQRFAIQQIQRYFFDDSDSIYRDQFVKKCHQITSSLNQHAIEKIFDFMKPNQKDELSILSFKIAFSYDQNIQIEPQYLPKQLQKQLNQIFNKHDKDKSGSIQSSQIQALLATLGFNQTQKQIQNIFMKIDKNFDNQISFEEFKQFIEQFILPHLIDFEDDVDQLFKMLKMNDVFNTGCVSTPVLMAVLQRFGLKITNQQAVYLTKYIGNQNQQIPILDFLAALYYPCNPAYPPIVKSALYKIKLRKKVSLKQIQKIFQNISSNFVIAYTSRIIKNQMLKRSTAFQPILHQSYLFYQDYFYKDFRKIKPSKNDKVLVDQDNKTNNMMVQIKIMEAYGVPIPQSQNLKGSILKRAMNITFFDMSAECAKHCIATLQADWDSEVEDQWIFDKNNRSIFMKISNYDPKKYQKILILFELIITLNDNGKALDVSCGSTSISVKQLAGVQSRLNKKLKLTSGIPTKSKQIDKISVTKRSGWKTFLGSSEVQSQIQIQVNHQSRFKDKAPMLFALPGVCLVKRKALHYIWTFREYFAERCIDKDVINPQFSAHHTVKAFTLSLDVDDISSSIITFWKQKIEQNIKQVWQARVVFYNFMTDLYMILHSKQFELKLSNPCATVVTNKSLYSLRQKMIREVFDNIENYVKNDLPRGKPYQRTKNYNYNYSPIVFQYNRGSLQSYVNSMNAGVKVGKN